MIKNPYLNACAAGAYIVFVVLLITYGPIFVRDKSDTIVAPIAVLSLLVFSVAFMACVFFLQPMLLYAEGKKREAVEFFGKTLGTFALITAAILVVAFT